MPSSTSLRSRVISAAAWSFGGHAASQALRMLSNLIMTRLLMPEAFGLMVIANTFVLGLALFSDIGLNQNIVQSKHGDDAEFVNTVWTLQILRGGLIWILSSLLALGIVGYQHFFPLGSDSVYSASLLPWVIFIIGFNAIISGFESTKIAGANRSLALHRIVLTEVSCQLMSLAVMCAAAYIHPSIWALVAGAFTSSILRVFISHFFFAGINNELRFNSAYAIEIIKYGKWVFVSSIAGFLSGNIEKFILGGLATSKELGIYSISAFMIGAVQQVFYKLSSSVAFPTLSEVVRSRPAEIVSTYYKLRKPIDILSLLMAGFLFTSGEYICRILYDNRYDAAGTYLSILSFILLEIRYSVNGALYMAIGKTNYLSPLIFLRLGLLCLLIPLGHAYFGMNGVMWSLVLSMLATIPLTIYFTARCGVFSVYRELKTLPFYIAGIALGYCTHFFPLP